MKTVRFRDCRASITNVSAQVDVKVTMNVVVVKVVSPVFARRFHVQIVKEMMIAQLVVNANSGFVFLSRDAVQTMTARRPRFARIDNAFQIRTCVETMLSVRGMRSVPPVNACRVRRSVRWTETAATNACV